MSAEENALLKADNERLNKIISIVVEQNELLKIENALLKKVVTPKDIINSFAKVDMAIKDKENALAKLDNGHNNIQNELMKSREGINDLNISNKEIKEGNNNLTMPIVNGDNAVLKENTLLPSAINPNSSVVGFLEDELRASGYNRISYSGVNNAAKLLIHFYNKGDGSYPALKKVTGHSTDGIAKFIMSMKKRGWINRYGFQQFGLTDSGVALIKQALIKSSIN